MHRGVIGQIYQQSTELSLFDELGLVLLPVGGQGAEDVHALGGAGLMLESFICAQKLLAMDNNSSLDSSCAYIQHANNMQ